VVLQNCGVELAVKNIKRVRIKVSSTNLVFSARVTPAKQLQVTELESHTSRARVRR
jgi:hypothetical protein